jgi:site-specific DNA-adenine methylase
MAETLPNAPGSLLTRRSNHEVKMQPPVTYQGAKQRIAKQVVNAMDHSGCARFFDLCCGSGAISLEMVSRGWFEPAQITMVDAGPWGLFWEAVGRSRFQLQKMEFWCEQVPTNRAEIKEFMEYLSKQPVDQDAPYVFLLLQAASFGGKAIWIKEGRWQNCSFRSFWQPTATSSRRSPVNPMMPMPETLYSRVREIVSAMDGVSGVYGKVEGVHPPHDSLVYIDPNYEGTTGYGHSLDIREYLNHLVARCYISEGKPLSQGAVLLSSGRSKGGISGERQTPANQEWLSKFDRCAAQRSRTPPSASEQKMAPKYPKALRTRQNASQGP